MPFAMIKLRPGVNSELTQSLNEAGYQTSNLGRYRNGLFEKIGGWEAYYPFAVGGVPRTLHAWQDLNDQQYLGVGSTTILAVISDVGLTNITPQAFDSVFAMDFSTSSGSPNVVVTDPNIANVTTYDSVEFLKPISIGGIVLSGVYPIALVLSSTSYRVVAASNATATVANAGTIPAFTTTSGSQVVEVTIASHGLVVGARINFPVSTTVGGVTIFGTYSVLSVSTSAVFTIGAATLATSSTTEWMQNAYAARLTYRIALGPATATTTGYGISTYGSGGYGTGTSTTAQTGTAITATNWASDNWGDIGLWCPEGGGVYQWQPNTGFQNAKMLSGNGAPAYSSGIFVSMQTQMLICYGSTIDLAENDLPGIGLDQDPLLVKWSNQGDYTDFSISVTSQAGSRRLSTGSKIVGGMSVSQQELLWTDLDLWSMSYLGSLQAGVWGFTTIGKSCGLIGKHAAARLGSNVFWMGQSNFFVLAGSGVQVIPCDIWDTIFQDLSTTHQHKCVALANTPYNEIWFMVVRQSTGATEPDLLAKYNILLGTWDYSNLDRSAGIDQSILGQPIYASSQGVIYEHEMTNDAAGQAIDSYFTTGDAQLTEGQDVILIDWVLPDMKWMTQQGTQSAEIQLTFYSKYYPGDTPQVHGPYTVTQSTKYINPRIRGRLVSMKVESSDVGSWWRIGGIRYRGASDGRL